MRGLGLKSVVVLYPQRMFIVLRRQAKHRGNSFSQIVAALDILITINLLSNHRHFGILRGRNAQVFILQCNTLHMITFIRGSSS